MLVGLGGQALAVDEVEQSAELLVPAGLDGQAEDLLGHALQLLVAAVVGLVHHEPAALDVVPRVHHAAGGVPELRLALQVHALQRAAELRAVVLVHDAVGALARAAVVLFRVRGVHTTHDADDVEEDVIKEYEEKFLSYINDDMNMPGAMSVVWDIARNTKKSAKFANLLLKFDEVLGLDMKNAEKYLVKFKQNDSEELPAEIKKLVEERKNARAEKNWAKSDEIRDKIISLGYSIKDTKDGIIVKKEN